MSDEELNDVIVSDDEPVSDDTPSTDTPSDNPSTPINYCTTEDIINLFGDNVSDTIETNLIETAISNATGWIHGRLRAAKVPLPDVEHPSSTIHTVAVYYAASDCYGALFNGDEYHVNFDMWYIKAKELLDDYISAYWNSCAEAEDQIAHQVVGYRQASSYNQKRPYRRFW